ncbi:cobalt transporter [Pseudodesulfovibrio senegalensis]|uniref:Cobalt transporter n=1 Tax=Pseudodesulfovibrio senegalensis TaxID=1721087 RepID=A0A6N6N5C8_9BACT|nr:cobalt transporter [Pseudodesulfovibrio senegalensis]KAB1443430.1 cobalt transporter [Pseudodesulfovibrio senegalensis]
MDWLRQADPRVKIFGVLVFGVGLWHTGVYGVLLCACIVGYLAVWILGISPQARRMTRAFTIFAAFWSLLKAAFGLWDGLPPMAVFGDAAFFGIRLLVLLHLGLVLSESTSARQIGRAFCWALRPLGTQRSWRFGLSLALMIHFIPMTIEVMQKAGQTLKLRRARLGFWLRMRVLPGMVMRIMAGKTWESALGVSARGLGRPEAWAYPLSFRVRDVFFLFGICLGGCCLFLL